MMTYIEALNTRIEPSEIGYRISSLDPLWVVCRLADYPDDDGTTHKELAFWCGTFWHFEWTDEMLVYTHREAVIVAEDVSERLVAANLTPAYPLSLGDYLRDEDQFMASYFRDVKRRCGDPKFKTSIASLASLRAEGRRGN